jgi:hypothetical protein
MDGSTPAAEEAITRDQATELVGKHLLVVLEDIIKSRETILADDEKTDTQKANARLVLAAAQGFGRPLFQVVKAVTRPLILRSSRSNLLRSVR